MNNFNYCVYTYLHRKEMEYKINKLVQNPIDRKELFIRAKYHDIDKLFLYLTEGKKTVSKYHRDSSSHHLENNIIKSRFDKLEAIMDYESAGLKADKNMNAFDTVNKLFPEFKEELMPLLIELGIAYSYSNKNDEELLNYINQFLPVTEDDIIKEINLYYR